MKWGKYYKILESIEVNGKFDVICDALRDLVPFLQLKKM